MATENPYDAMVLDVMLPDLDGFEVCRRIREAGQWAPVLMLTARDGVHDRVQGLDVGADDYLTKPFGMAELLARLRVVLRRSRTKEPDVLTAGDVTIDMGRHLVFRGGQEVHLTPTEFDLLRALLLANYKIVSRELQRSLARMAGGLGVHARTWYLQPHLDAEGRFGFALVFEDNFGGGYRREAMQVFELFLDLAVPGGVRVEAEIAKGGFHIRSGTGLWLWRAHGVRCGDDERSVVRLRGERVLALDGEGSVRAERAHRQARHARGEEQRRDAGGSQDGSHDGRLPSAPAAREGIRP
jgi:hypothetical protein